MKTIGGAKWKTAAIMRITALTMTPALAAAVWLYGIGVLLQVAVAVVAAVLAELLCLHLRKQPLSVALDGSAAVAGMIIGAALPPLAPWFVAAFAAVCAMTLAKHCYGGLGNNVFNPAMAGYALAFVSFPRHFDNWNVDTIGSPTPLAAARLPDIADNVYSLSPILPAACALGGLVLLLLRISDWRLSGGFILGAALVAAVYGDVATLLTGGLAFAAFFVITDPATAATSWRGRLLYAFVAGALVVWLRKAGIHTDTIAFAILAANMMAPLCDKVCNARRS